MNPIVPKFSLPLTAIVLATIAGQSTASQRAAPDDQVVEWVEISVHMPDGRVIKMTEPRYPSRSRVLLTTGKLPPFRPVSALSEKEAESQLTNEPGGDSADLTVDLEPEATDVNEAIGEAAVTQASEAVEGGTDLTSGQAAQETEAVAQAAVESNAAVHQFTKSN